MTIEVQTTFQGPRSKTEPWGTNALVVICKKYFSFNLVFLLCMCTTSLDTLIVAISCHCLMQVYLIGFEAENGGKR